MIDVGIVLVIIGTVSLLATLFWWSPWGEP
jgi:hypothetical protein